MSEPISPKCGRLFRSVLSAIFVARPREVIWQFLEKVVIVPLIAGSRASGPLNTGIMPQWRGLLEKYDDPNVHFFTLAKSARIGGTLFFGICIIIEAVLKSRGPIGWLDPTGKTAKSVSRREIEPYLKECKPLMRLAIVSKTTWTTLEKMFTNCLFTMLGAGSINDLGGRQWARVIINEQDRIPNRSEDAPTPSNEAEVRSSQFEQTRKIVRNSTPFSEAGLTWGEFIAGSQDHAYQPCPECHGYQRFTFFKEPAEPDRWMRVAANDPILATDPVPLNHGVPGTRPPDSRRPENEKHIKPAKDGRGYLVRGIPQTGRVWWPEECKDRKTGRWDVDKVAVAARYECAFCHAKWQHDQLTWLNDRYQLRSHNIFAPREHVSAHLSALYSPWQTWGSIAKTWLLAQGSAAKLRGFFNLILGIPAPCPPTKVTPKHIQLLQSKSPRYERQFPENLDAALTLPARPVLMTMQSDVNQDGCRYTIRALLVDGSRYVLAWGCAGGFTELDKIAARVWTYDHGEASGLPPELRFEEFSCYSSGVPTCIIDTGWKSKSALGVYQFIHDHSGFWVGVKGGRYAALGKEKPIAEETMQFNYPGRGQVDIPVILQNDFTLTEHLSRFVLKEGRAPGYYLPVQIDDVFIAEMTAPYLFKKRLYDGRTEDVWLFECEPHTYDAEKYGEVLCFIYEPSILQRLQEKQDARRKLALEKLTALTS